MRFLPPVAAVALLIMTTGARAVATSCGPASAHTIASDRTARVYTVGGVVYACVSGRRRAIALGHANRCTASAEVTVVALARDTVAYGLQRCGVDTGFSNVIVRRLPDNTKLGSFPATTAPLGPESYTIVDAVVVKPDGATAWIGSVESLVGGGRRTGIQVQRAKGHNSELLDSGGGIKLGSLRLHGSRFTWRDSSAIRSAALR